MRVFYRGATLAPWPNIVANGRYSFGGSDHQLPLTEPALGHALHGLVAWLDFDLVHAGPDRVTLAAAIQPQAGYPWRIVVTTTFSLDADGLTQRVTARNESAASAPWGAASHPYLVADEGTVDEWTLELPASRVLTVSPDRIVPIELVALDSGDLNSLDFRSARPIGQTQIANAYSGLLRDAGGFATVRVTDVAGSGVEMSWGGACPWVQIYTTDIPDPIENRRGLAVESMTCAPDAFNAASYNFDPGLAAIEPGGVAEASWRIAAIA